MGDFIYACVQLAHNLGAVGVVGCPATAWWLIRSTQRDTSLQSQSLASGFMLRRLAWLTFIAWSTQIASGAGFGATTYYLKHELPELTGVGLAALTIKVTCGLVCFCLSLIYLRTAACCSTPAQLKIWQTLFTLGLTALASAAFLRWYG